MAKHYRFRPYLDGWSHLQCRARRKQSRSSWRPAKNYVPGWFLPALHCWSPVFVRFRVQALVMMQNVVPLSSPLFLVKLCIGWGQASALQILAGACDVLIARPSACLERFCLFSAHNSSPRLTDWLGWASAESVQKTSRRLSLR